METGMIIGSVVVFLIIGFVVFVLYGTKDRKEPLTIMEDGNVVRFLLTDDNYDEIDISDIKNNKEKVYEEIKKAINYRSKELVRFVDRVSFFKDGDPEKEKELLNIILSAKV